MCAIVGALVWGNLLERVGPGGNTRCSLLNQAIYSTWNDSHERGRDGRGYITKRRMHGEYVTLKQESKSVSRLQQYPDVFPAMFENTANAVMIGNMRAEPTTEFVKNKQASDQQPYSLGRWSVVHNGTVANDKEIRACAQAHYPSQIDSAAIVELIAEFDNMRPDGAWMESEPTDFDIFCKAVRVLSGSFAILASSGSTNEVFAAVNYRPLWYFKQDNAVLFASARQYLPDGAQMVQPYSMAHFHVNADGELGIDTRPLLPSVRGVAPGKPRALVVCSGGMDSVVAATYAQRSLGYDVELVHFLYGSRAEEPEVKAVHAVAQHLGVTLHLKTLPVYDPKDSNLLQADSAIAGGEAGAEFAHEWVPARNLLLLSVAAAMAEAKGIETIVLGNNLEEAGAYPDNEPEFIARFNDLLPFAVGDGKRLRIIMPVGNMMKHEIVALGLQVGAPLHLTWSCYRAGAQHCGTCGPCYMRRKAFEINNAAEVIEYAV